MSEEWKPCYNGYYEVSNMGRVRRAKPGPSTHRGKVLRTDKSVHGYLRVILSAGGNRTRVRVHRLVAEAFLGSCPDGMEVNHKDGVKTNNHAKNLEWVTSSENKRHAVRNGLWKPHRVYPQATVREAKRLRSEGCTYKVISKATGMSQQHCLQVCTGKQRIQD